MKQLYLLLIAITFSGFAFAQTEGLAKIYGYKQKVMPGTVRVDDNGREVKHQLQWNYFIYLVSNTEVKPIEIWINGEPYSPITNKVFNTPVKYSNATSGNSKPTLLVPRTKQHVVQLSRSLNKIKKPSQKGKVLAAKNELVIIYQKSSKILKLYYKTISNLKQLESLNMQ